MDDATKIAVAILVVGVALAVVIPVGIYLAQTTIPGSGQVITFGVTADVGSLDWGFIQNGTSKQVSFNVTAVSSISGKLYMTHTYPDFLTLTWDSEGAAMQPMETRTVTFILSAAADAEPQTFSGDITITLTGGE